MRKRIQSLQRKFFNKSKTNLFNSKTIFCLRYNVEIFFLPNEKSHKQQIKIVLKAGEFNELPSNFTNFQKSQYNICFNNFYFAILGVFSVFTISKAIDNFHCAQ